MSNEALRTLFHPFDAGDLSPLVAPGKVLFLNAEPGFRLPDGFSAEVAPVQGFRPDFLALQRAGHAVHAQVNGENYDHTLVLAGRHRGRNELNIAEAIACTRPGGLIVVAGGKEDGIASLRKRIGEMVAIDGSLPKYHGIAFWFRRSPDTEAADILRETNPPALVDGRFHTQPGMFSFDRVDVGSKLLAQHLPTDLRGHVADFCAGWGYLSAETVARNARIVKLDLYEADFASLEAARQNLETVAVEKDLFWLDLLSQSVERRYDAIVMNPPFHRARAAEPEIGAGIIRAAAKALKPGGRFYMVANSQLPYGPVLAASFAQVSEIARDSAFKVFAARR